MSSCIHLIDPGEVEFLLSDKLVIYSSQGVGRKVLQLYVFGY